MIGLVLVTHGRLAEEFRSALEHVVGPQDRDRHRVDRPGGRARRAAAPTSRRRWPAVDSGRASSSSPTCSAARPPISPYRCSRPARSKCWPASTCRCSSSSPASATTAPLDTAVVQGPGGRAQIHQHRQPDLGRLTMAGRTVDATFIILNSRGLHARASAKFVKCAEQFDADIDGQPRRPDRARHLDHGPDDARRRAGHLDRSVGATARRPPRRSTRWARWSPAASARNDI